MSAVYLTNVKIEMVLNIPLVNQDGDYLTDENGNILVAQGWSDVSADVLTAGNVTWTRGNNGKTIFDRVGNVGTLRFTLNNSEANSALTAGYYSPDNVNVAARFNLDTQVRLTITENAVVHQEWQGTISSIQPESNQHGKKKTVIMAEDWMANAYRDKIRGITVQTSKRDDQIITTLLTLASNQPLATSFSTGDDTYTYSLHDENSLTSTLARVFQKLAMSGLGKIFLTGYGTLNYLTRSTLLVSTTPDATLNDTMTSIRVTRDKSQRIQDVFVTTYPAQLDTSTAVLWSSQRERVIAAGASVEFDVSLRDPSGRATRISATALTTPTADTDYKFSSISGSGNDLNASLGITATLKADVVTMNLTNNAGLTGYLWLHQQRGTGVYLYEPITVSAETGQADGETLDIDMVYQDDPNVGDDILGLVTLWQASDQSNVEAVSFVANTNQTLMDAAFLDQNDLVEISETQTGINEAFLINGWSKTLTNGTILQPTWYLVSANQLSGLCYLDLVGSAELDSTAILGA
jgi:hypothetical protein